MRSRSSLDALIVSSFDEHQTHQFDDSEGRLQFISGFSGLVGDAVVKQILFIFELIENKEFSR